MSAYLCNPEHIGVLANAMSRNGVSLRGCYNSPGGMAKALAKANWISIEERYGAKDAVWMNNERPFEVYEDECAAQASRPDMDLKPIDFVKMAHGFAYQACEARQFRDADYESEYVGQYHIDSFIDCMLRKMPGYDDAPWSYERKADAPEVIDIFAELV
jgi:hypothetical protein